MSDIKSTIANLCDVLKLCDFEINPVFFKLAKYDKTDDNVVDTFWNLLNFLCQNKSNDNIILNVKIYFAGLNYKNLEFYSLPDNMSRGSRELLIAFSWLLGKQEILDHPIKKKILESKISQEFDSNFPRKTQPQQEINVSFKTIQEYQNYILSLCGKINTNIKAISEYNMKAAELLDKVHSTTENLSVGELYHLKNKSNFNSYLQEIQPVSDLIEARSKWKSNEKYFWKWMITVIELKSKNPVSPMDKTNLKSFLKCLRKHVKDVLTKDNQPKQMKITIDETKFPRCIQSDESATFESQLNNLDVTLETLKEEEKRNVEIVYEYLRNLL